LWLFVTIGSGRLLVEGLKYALDRPRPPLSDQLVTVSTAAFPSSHSAGTMLTGMALLIAFDAGRSTCLAVVSWAMAIGFSRIMLGVHWPSDVLGGWGFGLLWVVLASFCLPSAHPAKT